MGSIKDYVEFVSLILDIKDTLEVNKPKRRASHQGRNTPYYVSRVGTMKGIPMVTLMEIKQDQVVEILDVVMKVLWEFTYVMPQYLPKLPPRRPIHHHIELISGLHKCLIRCLHLS
ncbi:hypothetical protein AAG906_028982 [Vitis piasezkii]